MIIEQSEIKKFYTNAFKNKINSKEKLFSPVTKEFKELLKRFPKNSKVLDLGYGSGNYSIECAKKGIKVTAIDFITSKYLKERIKNKPYQNNIKIIQKNLKNYVFKDNFDIILARDVFSFLSKKRIRSTLNQMIKHTNKKGTNYFTCFVDIKRFFMDGQKISIKKEANLSKKEFIRLVKKLYQGWEIKIKEESVKELNHLGLKKPFNFLANKITQITQNSQFHLPNEIQNILY